METNEDGLGEYPVTCSTTMINQCNPTQENDSAAPIDLESQMALIKGDAIGSTMYSERWVLKTLMALAKVDKDSWSAQTDEERQIIEEQLTSLWDMTFEQDIISFLMEHDFISLGKHIIESSIDHRLTEIMVGTIGNMTCNSEVRNYLVHTDNLEFLLDLLSTPDAQTLIQLMRLLNTCTWHVGHHVSVGNDEEELVLIEKEVKRWTNLVQDNISALSQNLSFILSSSTNEELLNSSVELLSNICCINRNGVDLSEFLATTEIVAGILEALKQLLCADGEEVGTSDLWSAVVQKFVAHWCTVFDSFTLHDKGIKVLGAHQQDIMRGICRILDALGVVENLVPLNSEKIEILQCIATILDSLAMKYEYKPPAVLPRILTLLSLLPKPQESQGSETDGDDSDNIYEYAVLYKSMIDYSVVVLNDTNSVDFLESFGSEPQPKIERISTALSKHKNDHLDRLLMSINSKL